MHSLKHYHTLIILIYDLEILPLSLPLEKLALYVSLYQVKCKMKFFNFDSSSTFYHFLKKALLNILFIYFKNSFFLEMFQHLINYIGVHSVVIGSLLH